MKSTPNSVDSKRQRPFTASRKHKICVLSLCVAVACTASKGCESKLGCCCGLCCSTRANNHIINLLENSVAIEYKYIDLLSRFGGCGCVSSVYDSIIQFMATKAMLLRKRNSNLGEGREKKAAKLLSDLVPKIVKCEQTRWRAQSKSLLARWLIAVCRMCQFYIHLHIMRTPLLWWLWLFLSHARLLFFFNSRAPETDTRTHTNTIQLKAALFVWGARMLFSIFRSPNNCEWHSSSNGNSIEFWVIYYMILVFVATRARHPRTTKLEYEIKCVNVSSLFRSLSHSLSLHSPIHRIRATGAALYFNWRLPTMTHYLIWIT